MESPTQQTEAEPLSFEKSAVGAEGELTASDTSSQLDEDHVCHLPFTLCIPSSILDLSLNNKENLKHHKSLGVGLYVYI